MEYEFTIEYSPTGWFCIVAHKGTKKEIRGEATNYMGIATLQIGENYYIAVGDYHRGGALNNSMFKPNVVYRIEGQTMMEW